MTDYKALYEAQLEENEKLEKKLLPTANKALEFIVKWNEESREIKKLKEIIQKQGDQLIIFQSKEEKPHNASSACAHAVLGVKNAEIEALKEENEKLKHENYTLRQDAKGHSPSEVQWFRLKIEELKGQNMVFHNRVCQQDRANMLLRNENENLKEGSVDTDHWRETMVAYMDYGDHWCHFDSWFSDNIDDDDKKVEWVKAWVEDREESDEETESE